MADNRLDQFKNILCAALGKEHTPLFRMTGQCAALGNEPGAQTQGFLCPSFEQTILAC